MTGNHPPLKHAGRFLLLALAAALPATAQAQVYQSQLHDFEVVTIAEGLNGPWSMAFLPEGDMLVTERPGNLRIIRNGSLLPDLVPGVPEVRFGGQGGLLDIALHPDFESNRLIYLSYSMPNADGSEGTTAVARARFEGDQLHDVEVIFEAEAWSTGQGHYGSRLAFDSEGYLFVTIGDRQSPPRGDLHAHPAQDLTNHIGTTVRLHDDGTIPADNPFVGRNDALPEIWSYGHRSPQGLAFHPVTGDLWQNEHGPQGGDELNFLEPGLNYGWPVIGFGVNYGSGAPIHETIQYEGMEQPIHNWTPSIATSGLMIYSGDAFPNWQGDYFIGGLAGQQISRVTLDGFQVRNEEKLLQGFGRIRDIRQGPDGLIYVAVDTRGDPTPIIRLQPVGQD